MPFLVASNSVNYGKPWNLNCAEAIAACSFICGFDTVGDAVMNKFKWGPNFYPLNEQLLVQYKNCSSSVEVCNVQNSELSAIEAEKIFKKLNINDPIDYFESGNINHAPKERVSHSDTSTDSISSGSLSFSDNYLSESDEPIDSLSSTEDSETNYFSSDTETKSTTNSLNA